MNIRTLLLNGSSLDVDALEQETSWTFPVEPPLHVKDPFFSRQQTWSLIRKVRVTLTIYASGERQWEATALGVPATKAGAQRGTGTQPVYGVEADMLTEQAQQYVVEQLDAP